LFEYLKQSTEEVAVRHQDEKILKIHERVKYLKRDRKLEAGYMTMEEYIHQEAERRAKLMAESMVKSMAESMAASRVAQNILALLEDLGTLPDQTKERIAKEQNEDVLSAWLKLAARADSIEEFQSKM
jgi:glycyl-tRNA synthetase beta subunit